MKIEYLADHPNLIPTLARWFMEASPDYYTDKTLEDVVATFAPRLNRGRVPLALVALENKEPLGTVSLLEESISTHTHLTPWLAGLHVAKSRRHQGIATKLIEALIKEAAAINIKTMYIGISRAEDFYTARGWQTVDKIVYYDKPLTIMQLRLN